MSENPSPEVRGTHEVEADAAMLAESLAYREQREIHMPTLTQHQARIAELLERQAQRADGQTSLPPMRTRVVPPVPPVPPPEPAPVESRPRLMVNGEEVAWPEPAPEPEEDAGTKQMLDEAEQL